MSRDLYRHAILLQYALQCYDAVSQKLNWTELNWTELDTPRGGLWIRLITHQNQNQNWTELNWTELNRSVEFSSVFRCALNRRWAATTVAGFHPMTDVALIERFTRVCLDCKEAATTANFVAESSRIIASRHRFNATRETQLNSSVELSSVCRCVFGNSGTSSCGKL